MSDISLSHSIAFQCNFVHEQTTLSPTSCSQKVYDLFLSFLHNFGFSKKMAFCRLHYEYWAVSLESLRLDILSNTETSKAGHYLIVVPFRYQSPKGPAVK